MIMSMKKSNDTIGNRTDLPACSAMPFEWCKYCMLHSISTKNLTKCFSPWESNVSKLCRQLACNDAVKFTFIVLILQYITQFNFGIRDRLTPLTSALKSA
jgi:hypothetical protein